MASKKNKQRNKTKEIINSNIQENYQSSLLKELKKSIAANKKEKPVDRTKKEDIATPIIIFKKKQYKCPYCSSTITPIVIDSTLPIMVKCLECFKSGKKDAFLIMDNDTPSWNPVQFL